MTKAVNLGCGKIILPCPKPEHHLLIPDEMYADGIEWDNVDWNDEPGVNKVVDLFNYPWHGLEDNTYDYALVSHLAEHIPHHIVWEGQFVHRHPLYQDGWFAFFAQLWRIMKPGGKAYVLAPYAFSLGAVSDPTHTRYLTPAAFNYFHAPTNGSPFEYRMGQSWIVNLEKYKFSPHEVAFHELNAQRALLAAVGRMMTFNDPEGSKEPDIDWGQVINRMAVTRINMITDFCIELTTVKDENLSQGIAIERSEMGQPSESMVSHGSQDGGTESIIRGRAAD